jgi:hypothetical protein
MMLREQAGSTLIEVLVAMCITITGVVTMAQLFRIAAVGTASARDTTLATIYAGQKAEEIRSEGQATASDTLQRNALGYVDHLDGFGSVVGEDETAPPLAVYTRRWSIEPLPGDPGVRIVQVLVTRQRNRGQAEQGSVSRLQDEARVVTLTRVTAP